MSLWQSITKRERIIWLLITLSLIGFIFFFTIAPSLLAQGSSDKEDQAVSEQFREAYSYIKENYVDLEKVSSQKLLDGALDGMFKALGDPYSAYYNKEQLRDLNDLAEGSFGGVGLVISKQRLFDKNGEPISNTPVEVVSPIEGTPAYKAGINAGDLIIKVEDKSTLEMSLDDVVKALRGNPGTAVTITVRRGESLEFTVTLTRAMIEIPTVKTAVINQKVAYLKIVEFSKPTAQRVREALLSFEKQGLKSLIIDIRSNPGGLLDSVIAIADYFLAEGQILSVRGRNPAIDRVYYARQGNELATAMKIAVLIDKGSASASEILAGALKDNKRATLFGERSYGKGTVQHLKPAGEGEYKLTVARYYTPSGQTVDKNGITPDVELKEEEYSEAEKAAYERLIKENLIAEFVKETPNPSDEAIRAFILKLKQKGIALRDSALRILILREVYRKVNNPPVFDLESDMVLKAAFDFLQK